MMKPAILILLIAFTAVFAIEVPTKDSKVLFIDINRVGDKIAEATVIGIVDGCHYGFNVTCGIGEYTLEPCGDSAGKRETFPCDENCECGVAIPSDGVFVQLYESEVCSNDPRVLAYGILDTCITLDEKFYTYTVSNNTITATTFATEGCEGEATVVYEDVVGECKNGHVILLTNDLEGSVATWVASVVLIVLSVVISA